jgi:hypothetical protein
MADELLGNLYDQATTGGLNADTFIIKEMINKIGTATLARVVLVNNNGEMAPVGFVDIQPMIHQVDGNGKTKPHGIISNVPYARMQGGTNAIIMDPKVGDTGIVVFNMRDHSAVKRTRAPAQPGSFRKYSMSDALFILCCLNGLPTQVLQFTDDGVNIITPGTIGLVSTGDINIGSSNGNVNITSPNNINITSGSNTVIDHKPFLPHKHPDPQGGVTGGVA